MSGAMQWSGTALADRFVFDGDYDRLDYVLGGLGDDYISDGADDAYWSDDVFLGQDGNDTLISTEGNDLLRGGQGDDTLEITLGWYDPAELQFPLPGVEHGKVGFDVEVRGGQGWDTLTIHNSDGFTIERDGHHAVIHTVWGGTVTVHGIEEFQFL
jgi:Ca2+-binding RTX toxin-like protein